MYLSEVIISANTTPLLFELLMFCSLSWPNNPGCAKQVQSIPALALARTAANLSIRKHPGARSTSERPNPMTAELWSNNRRRWGFRWDAVALVRRRLKDSDTIHPRAQGNGAESRVVVRLATGGTNNDENKGAPDPIALSCTTLHTCLWNTRRPLPICVGTTYGLCQWPGGRTDVTWDAFSTSIHSFLSWA